MPRRHTPGNPDLRSARVDIDGLSLVLGEYLYSNPAVAFRELIQNAHDGIQRRRAEDSKDFDARIDVRVDTSQRSIHISDNGSGLTGTEIDEFLATIGRGYTRSLRNTDPQATLIGYFGLGFLSAFMVSDRVEVTTTSYQNPSETWRYISHGAGRYAMLDADIAPIGTTVTLHLKPDFDSYLDDDEIRHLLLHFCRILAIPVHLNGEEEPINGHTPPWVQRDTSSIRHNKLRLDFVRDLFGADEPLATTDIAFPSANGYLWINEFATYGTSDNRQFPVFIRGMLVDPNHKDLLPDWAGFVSGMLDASSLSPTASREGFVFDESYRYLKQQIQTLLVRWLGDLPDADPPSWRRVLSRHNEALLGAALTDHALFDRLSAYLRIPTDRGDLELAHILRQSGGEIRVTMTDTTSMESLLLSARGVPVVKGYRYGALAVCRRYAEQHNASIVVLGTERGNKLTFSTVDIEHSKVEKLAEILDIRSDERVEITRFQPEYLPVVAVSNYDAILKARIESDDADKRISQAVLHLARIHSATIEVSVRRTFYVNLASPLVEHMLRMADPRNAFLGATLRAFIDCVHGDSQGGPPTDDLNSFRRFFENLTPTLSN